MTAIDSHAVLALFHIFIIAPLFFTVAYMRSATPDWLYWIFLILGCVIIAFHGYKMYLRYIQKSDGLWINAIHVFLVAPLLIYIGTMKKETLRFAYELLFMEGFAVLGYHTLSLIRSIETMDRLSTLGY